MKQIVFKSALMRMVAVILLTLGAVSASAQYYMNIRTNDGTNVQYVVTDIDSVWFTGPAVPAYEYVDLGLSVNWATFNVGATKPEEYGDYFAWGETETKTDYSWSTYKWCNGSDTTLTRYNYYYNCGTIDYKRTLNPEDDVAHVKWGGSWRMPTKAEQDELRDSCTWTWYRKGNTEFNGVAGYKVTSNKEGYTDRSIFLPAAGYRNDTRLSYVGSNGLYWSSSLSTDGPNYAYNFYFNSSSLVKGLKTGRRDAGRSVRPVCQTISVKLDQESATLHVGESVRLTATVMQGNDVVSYPVTWTSDAPEYASVDAEGVVTAKAIGKAKITASVQGKSVSCIIEVTYEYVDLGLSVKWATFNVGATKPEEYGDYFAWGEIEPYYEAGYAQEDPQAHWKEGKSDGYTMSSYNLCSGLSNALTKYNTNSRYGRIDNNTTLDLEDDVAHVLWGGSWRMPTKAERDDLRNNCIWTWYSSDNTEFNGVAGYKVTSNIEGYTDRFIFLPAAGYRDHKDLNTVGSNGYYWSSSLYTDDPNFVWSIYFNSSGVSAGSNLRHCGHSVRPVRP